MWSSHILPWTIIHLIFCGVSAVCSDAWRNYIREHRYVQLQEELRLVDYDSAECKLLAADVATCLAVPVGAHHTQIHLRNNDVATRLRPTMLQLRYRRNPEPTTLCGLESLRTWRIFHPPIDYSPNTEMPFPVLQMDFLWRSHIFQNKAIILWQCCNVIVILTSGHLRFLCTFLTSIFYLLCLLFSALCHFLFLYVDLGRNTVCPHCKGFKTLLNKTNEILFK